MCPTPSFVASTHNVLMTPRGVKGVHRFVGTGWKRLTKEGYGIIRWSELWEEWNSIAGLTGAIFYNEPEGKRREKGRNKERKGGRK